MYSRLLVLLVIACHFASIVTDESQEMSDILLDCPVECECLENTPKMVEVNCIALDLTTIPISGQVMEFAFLLDVSSNEIEQLNNNTFVQYPNLRSIYASMNSIDKVEINTFYGLDYLQEIDLSENSISYLHPDTFSQNNQLELVNLSGNPLVAISNSIPLLNSPMLKSLDLSYCKLTVATPEMFSQLANLKSLDLSNNDIEYFSLEILSHMEQLVDIRLNNNRLSCDCNTANVLKLLDLRRPQESVAHRPVRCVEVTGQLRKYWSVASDVTPCTETQAADVVSNAVLADVSTTTTIEPTRDAHSETSTEVSTEMSSTSPSDIPTEVLDEITEEQQIGEVFGGLLYFIEHNIDSVYIFSIVVTMFTLVVMCAAVIYLRCYALPRTLPHSESNNKQPSMRRNNLDQAFNNTNTKRNSETPLLTDQSSEPIYSRLSSQDDPPSSLYEEYINGHVYETLK